MLYRDTIALNDVKRARNNTNFIGHVSLFNMDGRKVFSTGNTRNKVLADIAIRRLANNGTRIRGAVGIFNLNGNVCLAYRKDCFFLQDRSSHIGKLTHLIKGNASNGTWMFNDMWVSGKKTGNIGPVLIQSGIKAASYDGTGNVSPATLEKLNCPIDGGAIKTRKHKGALTGNRIAQARRGALHINGSVMMEDNNVSGIDKGHIEILCQKITRKPFSTRNYKLR